MNGTSIFINNGQLNWDAISVISNIILVAALVVITAFYAREVRRHTELMVQDRERKKNLEEVQDVLTPTIRLLDTEIEAIKGNKIFWHRYTSGESGFSMGLSKLLSGNKNEFAVRELISKSPELDQMFFSHDALYDKLNALYTKIENEVKSPELKNRLETLVKKFNESRVGGHILRGDSSDDPDRYFGAFIINHKYPIERSPNSNQPNIDFWENIGTNY